MSPADHWRSVLLTGASGNIGKTFRRYDGGRYRLRLADRELPQLRDGEQAETLRLDVADLDACRAACAGIETVVHLAADPSPEADFYGSLLDNNIKGVFNIHQAALDAGVKRVIFTSSVHAVTGYLPDAQPQEDWAPRPRNMYGASKAFGEAVGSVFAARGLTTIAIRIAAFNNPGADPPARTPREAAGYISPRDMSHLLARCIEADLTGFHVVHGLSDNALKVIGIAATRRLLGYDPRDDGFAETARREAIT